MKILLADDHIMTIEGYKSILNSSKYSYVEILNCEQFYKFIMSDVESSIDIAVIDYNMPVYEEKNIRTGVDCCLLIKEKYPKCKIIMITSHEEALLLYRIYRDVRPDALLVKSDFTNIIFKNLIKSQNYDLPYLSLIAKNSIHKVVSRETLLDSINREIIVYLSYGFKAKQLDELLPLSVSAIQKRIGKMITDFDVKDYQELILLARDLKMI